MTSIVKPYFDEFKIIGLDLFEWPRSYEMLETKSKFSSMISDWTKDEMMQNYEKAIKHHIPENNWRLVN